MYNVYFDYLKKFSATPLTSDEKALIRRNFRPLRLRKKEYLLQAGDICENYAFIVKGAMRMYSVDDRGQEHVIRLGLEDWWMGDRESFFNLVPSRYHIDALEPCHLLCITRERDLELLNNVPAYGIMKMKLDQQMEIANNQRLTSALADSAAKRYTDLIQRYPAFADRFPQHIIASYLGISKDTLSRVKLKLKQTQ
ncbi:Crp/Fnr family transcriptional regulator [Pedobacter sp. MC2016-15]|uniref:Crp/Fnr family transcriptional regulator n=1 Tax=Pedobacter sp. MC2016-15 TaxID=2994473 RepID=UPI002245DBF1|nr:Crp/Fnr family transcriptional regulator [Pedobacter sp. MC2016-15]MCX2477980.1 Crp/Fnr family transcriptional regulator [Pedobacter sp. MC2016-15]